MANHLRFDKGNLAMQAVVLFVVLVSCFPVFKAQEYKVIYKQIPDNRGTEFVIAFMQQFKQELDGATRLFITSDYNTRAVIKARWTNVRKELEIKARQLYPVDFPTSIRMEGTKVEQKGIHIKSEEEIVVYGLNIKKFTTDAYLALPVDIQSTKYIIPSFTVSQASLIGIVAIHDRTTIFITFRFTDHKFRFKYRGKKYGHKDTLSLTMSKLETFQVAHAHDMTGTRIFSTKPISVLSGNECANVPKERGYCDHLVEHIPPTNTWGQRFITAPLAGRRGGDFFRILASNYSTDVRINGKYIKTLDEGKFVEVDVPSDRYQYIETNKPCLVVQYSKGQRVDNTFTDPFMVIIPPVEQYTAQYTVSTPDQNEQYFRSYINIIIHTKQIDGLRLDGRTLREEKWVPVWGTTHSAARIAVSHGVHRVIHDSPIVPFAIFLYGYARADSYGYPGGLRLADLTLDCVPGKPGDGLDNDCDRRIDEEIKNFIDDDNDGLIDEDLVTEPPEIILDAQTLILSGCPAQVKKKLKEPHVISAPLCSSRGPIKLSFVDSVHEQDCVQYIDRMWLVRDGCGNLANVTQQIRIRRPEISVTFPDDVRGLCHVGEDLSVVGEPKVKMSCKEDRSSVKYRDNPDLVECIRRGRTIGRDWTVKTSCGRVIKHMQKLLPDVTPPKLNFVGKLQYRVKRDFRISWNSSEIATFECSLDGPNEPKPCGRGWGETWSKRDIPDGKHVFWVRATDLAGNTGAYIRHPFDVDNSGPRLEFVRPLQSLSQGPMAIKWRSNEMARFKCGLNPDRMEQCGSGTEGKDYRRDLQDGTYTFYVGAVDQIGNEATIIKHTFKIDSTPPRIKFGRSLRPTINSKVDLPLLSNEPARFSCSLDDKPYTPCGDGVKGRFTASNLAEGPHKLKVKAVDEAGNVAEPISLDWNSDKTSPNILFTPGQQTKYREKPKVTWTSTEWANFECSLDDNTRFRPCGQGSRGQWTKDRVPEGFYDLFVRGTDRHGNVGPTVSFRFFIDNKHPLVYLKEPLPKTSASPTATFRWTSNEMAYYKCAVDDTSKFQDCGSGRTGDWTTPSLTNGEHTFYLTAKDEVGNSAPMLRHRWKIDNIAPVLKFSGDLPDNVNKNKQQFSWTASEYAEFDCFIDSETNSVPCGRGKRGSWTSNELDDGPHTFRVSGTDEHGNQGPVIQHTWDIDTTSPTVNLAKVPETINKPKAKFNWKTNEPAKFLCALDDDTEGKPCGTGTDGEYLTPTLVDGEHEFRLLVEDMVGNMAPLVRSKFNIDTSLPVITFDKPDPKTPQKDLSITWKSSEDSEFECALDDPTRYEECGKGETGGLQKDDLPDGKHRLYVRGKDEVGNVGQPSIYTVTTDRSPPSTKFTDKYNPLSKKPYERFTWSSDETATYKCKVDEREETDCGQGTDGAFQTPNLPDGEHVFQVTPIDVAGNKGKMLERKWIKDSTPPDVRYTSQPPEVSRDNVAFKWSASEDSTFECALDDTNTATECGRGTSGNKKLSNLPKGSRVFWVRGTDKAGNVGEFVPHRWKVDTNPPGIDFTGDLPSFSKKSLTFSWKSDEDSKFECALDNMTNFSPCGDGMTGRSTLRDLPEGKHTFYVRARDRLDNIGNPISHSWIVDSIPPRATLAPVNSVVGTPRVTLSWKADERSKFLCAIGDEGNVIECGQGTSGSWTTPYLRRGPQKFWLIAEDYTGNRAEPVSVGWVVDNRAPVVTFNQDSTDKSTTGSPRFSWTSDEPAKFECAIQGVTAFEDCGTGTNGTWTRANVPDGKRTFLVRARDPYGNQDDPFTFPFEVDTTPPTGFAVTGPPRRTNIPKARFTWKTSEDASYDCYVDNQVNPTKCGVGTNGEFTTSSLPDGEHDFSVVATDDLGNKATVVNAKWAVDTSGPKLSFPSNLPKNTLHAPFFNWTSDERARFECSLDSRSDWEYCGTGDTGAWQRFNIPDGKHELFVRGTDDLGNTGPQISHPFNVDSTAPRVRVTSPPDRSSSTPTIKWSSTEDVDFKCSFNDGQFYDCGDGKTGSWTGNNVPDGPQKFQIEGKDAVGNTGKFTYSWTKDSSGPAVRFDNDLPKVTLSNPRYSWTSTEPATFECSLDGFSRNIENCGSGTTGAWQRYKPDGKYELSVRGKDDHGNTGNTVSHQFTVDNTAPKIEITSTSDLATSQPTIKWSSTEEVQFECSVDDGDFFNCGDGKTGSWTGRNLPDGPHKFVIQGKDAVKNTGRHTYTWNKDSSGPAVKFDDNLPKVTLRAPSFSWTSAEPATFECSLDGFGENIENCGSGTSGTWQRYKPDGKYELSVRGKDKYGNTGNTVSHQFTVDNTAPSIKITSQPDATSSKPTIKWSSSEDVNFQCSVDYGNFVDCGDGTTGSWTGDNLPDGSHTIVIQGKDAVDNSGKLTLTWKQDSVAPVVSFRQLPDSADRLPRFEWTSTEPANFECSLDGANYESCGSGYDGRWQKTIPGGDHTFSVRGKDEYGNVGEPVKHTWTIDSSGPVITLDAPVLTPNRVTFSWKSNKAARFSCAIDDQNSWQYCGSGTSGGRPYYNLPDGKHTFYVRGVDVRRNIGDPASHEFTVDGKPPTVTVNPDKSVYPTRSPAFTWSSDEDATFECAIDDTRFYQPCGDGRNGNFTASNVPDGRHAFFIQGKDKSGNRGPHVRYIFNVDTRGPQVYFTSNVPRTTKNPRMLLTWLSNEDASFQCTVDGKTTHCGNGTEGQFTTPPLTDGKHTFTLSPVDKVGNKGTPVIVSWETDSSSPEITFKPQPPPKTSRYPKVSWISSEFAYFECDLDGTQRSCGQGPSGDMTFGVTKGPHTFSVRGTDRNGNVGEWKRYSFDVDTDGPQISFPSNQPKVTKGNPTFKWTSSEPAKFLCGIDSSFNLVDCGSGPDGQWTKTGIPDGQHVFIVIGTDDLGNQGPYAQHRFTVDSTVPEITFQNPPDATNSKPQLRWTSSENARFECSLDGANYVECGSGFYNSWTGNNLPDGKHEFSVRGRDKNGNVGQPATHQWNVDSVVPALTITSDNPSDTNAPQQTITWDSSENAKFECRLDGQIVDCGSGTSGRYTTPNLPDGKHTFSVNAVDDVGNKGTPEVVSWSTDKRAPSLRITSNNPSETNSPTQTITWDSSENAKFECKLDGQIVDCGSGTSGRYTTPNLPNGRHTFSVNGVDDVGNKGTPEVVSWSTDKNGPVLTITSNNPSETNNPRQTITWDSSENAKFECKLDGQIVDCGSGTSGRYITPNMPDGKHTFSVNGVDDVGNKGTVKDVSWSTDKRPPVLRITSDNPSETNEPEQTITWDSSENAKFECRLDGQIVECGSGTSGRYTTPNLPNGKHTFSVNGEDSVGNKGTPEVVSWSTDNRGPVLRITSNNPSETNDPRQTITWDSSENAKFECKLDGQIVECGSGTSGRYTTPSLPDGKHKFSVEGVDDLGNKGTPKVVNWLTDKQPPVLVITSNNPPKTKNKKQTITWSSSENAKFECKLDGRVVECGSGHSGAYTTPDLPDGKHEFTVNSMDDLGNKATPKVVSWSTDTEGPYVQITTRIPPQTNKPKTRIAWISSEPGRFECVLDGIKVACGRGNEGEYTTPELGDGKHWFSVNSVDSLGNKRSPKRVDWETDSTAPDITFPSTLPKKTSANPQVTWGSSEPSDYECALDDRSKIIRCGRGTTGDWNGLNTPHGPHTFWVRGTDRRGNVGEWKPYAFEVDSNGPAITFGDMPKITKNNPTFKWSSSEPANFKCRMENSFKEEDCGDGNIGQWTGNQIPDGPHKFLVYGVDEMNNQGPTAELEFNVDATGPKISFPADQPVLTKTNPTFTWTSSEPASFKCGLDDGRPAVDCGKGTSGQFTFNNIPDGPVKFLVYGIDDMNNRGPTAQHQFVVDNSAPIITFDRPEDVTDASPEFTWSSQEDAQFECSLDGADYERCGRGKFGVWNGKNVPHGKHVLSVRGRDKNNNVGEPARHTWNVDTNPPKVQIQEPFPKKTQRQSFNIRWISDENARYLCSVDDKAPVSCGFGKDGQWWIPGVNDGEHTFSLIAVDVIGNRAPAVTRRWTLDTTGPTISFPADLPVLTKTNPKFTWTSSEPASFKCGLDDGRPAVDCGSGTSGEFTFKNIPDGPVKFLVYGTDDTNNRGPTAQHKFVVDSTPPQITFSGDLPETTSKNPTLTWTSSEYATFECKVDDGAIFRCGGGKDGAWTGNDLSDGSHSLSVRGTDELGNTGQFISRSWNVDESGPRLHFLSKSPRRARRLPRFRWASNEYASFECSLNGRNFTRCSSPGLAGSWTKEEISNGWQTFRVRGRDSKGNVGEPISVTIDIDTTGPKVKLLKPLPTKTKQPTWTFLWTADEISNFTCAVDRLAERVDCGFGMNGRFTTKPMPDGRHRFYLLPEDELGNTANIVTHTWVVDKTKPEIEFQPNQPEISDADITLLWKTVAANKPATFECALDNVRNMRPCGEGTTGSWSDSNIPDGDHTLYVRAKDTFGDYGKIKTHTWKVDTRVPHVKLIGTPPRRSPHETGSFYWTSDENATYECAIDLAESGTPCGSGLRKGWTSPELDDGEHTFYLFATDTNGNQAAPVEYKWEIDTEPPIVTLDENAERVSSNNMTLKWRTNENAIFQCSVDSIFDNRDCGYGRTGEIKLTDLEEGPHTIWIKAADELDNSAPWKEHTWIVDSTPPELEFTSELPTKTNGDVKLFWNSKEPTNFKCGTDANNLKDCGSGHAGNWSAKNLTDGEHEFFVEATDEFGNTIRIVHKWVVDNKPPVLSWRKKVPDVTGKLIKFRWRSDERADFFCAHEKIDDMVKCGEARLKSNWVEKDLPEGKHRFWVMGVDDVGNRGLPLYHEWTVDTKGPTLFFNQPTPKKSGRSVRFSWRSNERAKFSCAFDNTDAFFDCGEGFEAQLRSDNLRRNGAHVLYVKGIDDHGNEGEIISTRWIVDLVAPVLIDVGPLPRLMNRNPIITWTVNEESVFECALDDENNYKWCGNGTTGEWKGKNLSKGDHRIIVRVKDPQGNTNTFIDHKFVVGIPDNRGRQFMLGFMQQYLHKKSGFVSLFITSDNHTVATIDIKGVEGGFKKDVSLQPDELVRVDLPISVRMSGTQKENKGILVTAANELVVYGLNIMAHSTDAFLALPTDIQGTEYYAVSYTVSQHSLVGIIGIYDDTLVYITLRMSKDVPLVYQGAVYRNKDTMIIELDRQNTFQLTHTEDLTGTRIASTQVVSVYSGSECANVPQDKGYCDHLVEMLTPTSTWGRRFITAPLFSRKSGDFFRVVASQDDTMVVFHPDDQELLQAGDFMERNIPSDEYKFISATKPCMLMQYSKGADTDNTDTDPFLLMIPPIEQYGSHYILSTPDRPRQQYFQSYINVIVLSEHFRGVLVDGKPAYRANSFKRIAGTPYSASAVKVTKGVHRVDHTSPIITFGAFMYGYAWRDSYGYPGGLRLADITGECTGVDTPADGMDNDCDRRIDEELKNGIDDDGDGRIDEDLATFPPTIELKDSYYEYESCVFEVDALVPQPKAVSSAECNFKGELRVTYRDSVIDRDCTQLINRTWQASDGCGNVVYLTQIIKIIRPRLVVRFPLHVPNGCVGQISLRATGRPEVESPCKQEKVRVAYRDTISKKDCQENGRLLERHFTVTEVCGRDYYGVQRIYPGART